MTKSALMLALAPIAGLLGCDAYITNEISVSVQPIGTKAASQAGSEVVVSSFRTILSELGLVPDHDAAEAPDWFAKHGEVHVGIAVSEHAVTDRLEQTCGGVLVRCPTDTYRATRDGLKRRLQEQFGNDLVRFE